MNTNASPAEYFIDGHAVLVGDDVRVEGLGIARVLAFEVEPFGHAYALVLAGCSRRARVSVLAIKP